MASDQDRQRAEKRFKQEFPFYLFDSSDANAFRTFDWDNPNCRAIRDGVMPALKAARTAFTWPRVSATSGMSTLRRRGLPVADDRFVSKSGRTLNRWRKACKSVSTPGGILPRRFISSSVAACSKSNSPSLKYLTALGRSFGKIYRCVAVSIDAFEAPECVGDGAAARTVSVEKRSGVGSSAGSRPIL